MKQQRTLAVAKTAILGLIFAYSITGSAFATVVLMDDFDSYTNGNLSGQGGWTATAAAATPMQVAGGANKYVQINTSGQDEYKAFTSVVTANPGESIETKFDINVSAAQALGDYFTHLSNPAGTTTTFIQRVFARSSTNGFQLGLVDTSGTGSTTTWGVSELSFGTPYSVKVTWNFVAGSNNDTFVMDVNNVNYLNHTWTSATAEPAALAAANLRQGSSSNAPTLQFDNLMVTAVPEPASLMCILSGLLWLVCTRHR